jgi:hypothetical protein
MRIIFHLFNFDDFNDELIDDYVKLRLNIKDFNDLLRQVRVLFFVI